MHKSRGASPAFCKVPGERCGEGFGLRYGLSAPVTVAAIEGVCKAIERARPEVAFTSSGLVLPVERVVVVPGDR
jgi:hypothetical protein